MLSGLAISGKDFNHARERKTSRQFKLAVASRRAGCKSFQIDDALERSPV
jgi:hypothetical protein